MEWHGINPNGMERNGTEWNGKEWNGMEWNGTEWNGMEWNGMGNHFFIRNHFRNYSYSFRYDSVINHAHTGRGPEIPAIQYPAAITKGH